MSDERNMEDEILCFRMTQVFYGKEVVLAMGYSSEMADDRMMDVLKLVREHDAARKRHEPTSNG